jgi:hypothetical protein
MRPVDAVTLEQAGRILGVARSTVQLWVIAGRIQSHGRREHRMLSQGDVEQLATLVYDWRDHLHDPTSYWVTGKDAAAVLGFSHQRLGQLAVQERVPYIQHVDGVRLYRRAQLETVANSRDARWRRSLPGP